MITKPVPALLCTPTGHTPTSRTPRNLQPPWDDTSRYFSVRGRVTSATTDGATESIEHLAQKYTGHPYASYGGPGQTRLLLTITVDSVIHSPIR